MAVVSLTTNEGKNAARKLPAMGSLARPVLKKVLETTLDPEHRRELALILAQRGDFSELKTALDPVGNAKKLVLPRDRILDGIWGYLDAPASARHHSLNSYPSPWCVMIWRGRAGVASSFCLR